MVYFRNMDDDEYEEPNSTPKLILSKLPCKPRQPTQMQMLTPPLHPSVSIPFRWEEAPGKPRTTAAEVETPPQPPAETRCLDLPPRLMVCNEQRVISTSMNSPTTVLEGPYVGRSLSLACTSSYRKEAMDDSGKKFGGSGRWRSFREETKFGRVIHELSPPPRNEKNVKIKRVGKWRSFFSLSAVNSSLWADISESFKQVIPWGRNRPWKLIDV